MRTIHQRRDLMVDPIGECHLKNTGVVVSKTADGQIQ